MNSDTLIDPATGEAFVPNRSNHKHKTTKTKNKFHNANEKAFRNRYKKYFDAIKKNLRLIEMWTMDNREVRLNSDFMQGAGYNFNFYSGAVKDSTGSLRIAIGPFTYKIENQTVIISRYE